MSACRSRRPWATSCITAVATSGFGVGCSPKHRFCRVNRWADRRILSESARVVDLSIPHDDKRTSRHACALQPALENVADRAWRTGFSEVS